MAAFNPRTVLRRALIAVVFNTVLALGISAVKGDNFPHTLLYSQLIGLGIWAGIDGGRYLLSPAGWPGVRPMAVLVVVSVFAGYGLGLALGNLLLGRPLLSTANNLPGATVGFLLMSLAIGTFGAYYFTSREMLAKARLAQEEAQRQASEARLRLLESQLEPHMLFNTLANLRALIATDPSRAIDMLDRLNGFLRATLAASRSDAQSGPHTLREEFARLADYLELMAVRMGPRLRVRLELPEALAALPVPPLLLQPLVENAIRHGLEPSTRGGEVAVSARRDGQRLHLSVRDDGVGSAHPGNGFGLSQVRERLQALHGDAAQFDWRSRPGEGTQVHLQLPLPEPHRA
ncbi:MAG: histidine kinase [Hydrogenophaga sp.]|nr:histidine kinase [Hydrogenophaga sp.]